MSRKQRSGWICALTAFAPFAGFPVGAQEATDLFAARPSTSSSPRPPAAFWTCKGG